MNVTAQACAGREAVIVKETDTIKEDWNKDKDALRTRSQGNKELTQITTVICVICWFWWDQIQWDQGPSQADSQLDGIIHMVPALES